MKQPTSKEDKKNNRETLNSLCSVSALLLSVVCCMALIHVELRIQENHRLITHSVTLCDQMETQILRKVQQNYERQQVTKADGITGHLQGTNGKERFYKIFCFLILTSACFRSWRLWKLSLFNIRGASSCSKFVPTTRLESAIITQAYNRWGCQEQGNTKANQRKDILNKKNSPSWVSLKVLELNWVYIVGLAR